MKNDWPIFVLTLEGDEVRRQPLIKALAEAGLDCRIFFGVDGRLGLPPEYDHLVDRKAAERRMRRPMSDAEFACALSHRSMYETILAENLSGAIILEDDAVITPDLIAFIGAGFHRTDTIILMDYSFGRALPWQRKPLGRWTLHRAAQRATLSSTYSISRMTAARLLEETTPVTFVADWPVDLYALRAWLVNPKLAYQSDAPEQLSHLSAKRDALAKGVHKSVTRYLRLDYYKTYIRRWLARRVGR